MNIRFGKSLARGRIHLNLTAFSAGADLCLLLTGGDAHIGAVAVANCGRESWLFEARGHREGELATGLASLVSGQMKNRVSVIAGIHFDKIKPGEIEDVLQLARELAACMLACIRNGEQMLTIEQLDKLEKELKSGEFEATFRCSSEEKRLEMLELLEKLMDVADLADEVATRLIFRGVPPSAWQKQ